MRQIWVNFFLVGSVKLFLLQKVMPEILTDDRVHVLKIETFVDYDEKDCNRELFKSPFLAIMSFLKIYLVTYCVSFIIVINAF